MLIPLCYFYIRHPSSLILKSQLKEDPVETASIRREIPKDKFRVVGIDLFSHEDYLVKDCDTRDEAFQLADENNKNRSGSMDDVYYVYDDTGKYLRGEKAVAEHTGDLGVSP